MKPAFPFVLAICVVAPSIALSLSGCKQVTDATPAASAGRPVAGSAPSDAAGLYITVVPNGKYTYKVHKDINGTGNDDCVVKQADKGTAASFIDCFVEAKELDLYYHGADLNFNVPSNMCSYYIVYPYWYYRWPVGDGARDFTVKIDKFGQGAISAITEVDPANGVTASLNGTTPKCKFDYTSLNGPNCCLGKYTVHTATWDTTANDYGPLKDSAGDWGGNITSCLGGPAVDTQPIGKSGFPMSDIYYVEGVGKNGSYSIPSPMKSQFGTNVYAANYYGDPSLAPTNVPLLRPDGTHGTFFTAQGRTPQAGYSFVCYDRAQEIQSWINVWVRDWDVASEFDDMTHHWNTFHHSADDCETGPYAGASCNDRWGWLDFGNQFPAWAQ